MYFNILLRCGGAYGGTPHTDPTSMSYVYTVFQHLDMLWMGIWVYPYTVTSVQVGSGV